MARDTKPGKSGAVRPTVIEGKAREIKGEIKGKGEKPEKQDDKQAPGAVKKPAEAKKSPDKAKKTPEKKKPEAGNTNPGKPEEKKPARKKPAGAASGKGRKRGFIAAGLLFLIAVSGGAGAWLYDQYGPGRTISGLRGQLSALSGKVSSATSLSTKAQDQARQLAERLQAMSKDIAALKSENASLKKTLAELKSAPAKTAPAPETAAAIATLKKQTAAMADIVNANAKGLAETRRELSALSGKFKALSAALDKAAKSGAAAPAAQSASASLKLEETRQAIAALKARLDALDKGLDERIARAGGGKALSGLKAELEAQKAALEALKKQTLPALAALKARADKAATTAAAAAAAITALKKNPPKPVITAPPAGIAFTALRARVMKGEPFAAELEKFRPFAPAAPGLDELEKIAAKGAPLRSALKKQLTELAARYEKAAQQARREKEKSGLVGALTARFSKVVKVRRKDEADWPGSLKKALAAMDTSLTAAISLLKSQPGPMPEDIAAWVDGASRRMIADKAMAGLGETVLSLVAAQSAGKTK